MIAPRRACSRQTGFTLVELSVALAILGLIVTFVYEVLWNAVKSRDIITEGLESPKVDNAIFDQLARDFRYLYYQTGQLPGDAGFWGRDRQISGMDADRVDFVTARKSRIAELEEATSSPGDSPLTEVGYVCRANDTNNQWLELWRREDYFIDDDPTDGGKFSMVYDKIRRFSLRYFPLPEDNGDTQGIPEWDSKTNHKVPYAIILDMSYDVREPAVSEPQTRMTKMILIKPATSLPPDTGMTTTPGMR